MPPVRHNPNRCSDDRFSAFAITAYPCLLGPDKLSVALSTFKKAARATTQSGIAEEMVSSQLHDAFQ